MNGEGNQDNPGGRNSGGGKLMSFLAGVNLLATIVIAVFAAFIDNRQKILQGQQADLKAALDARVQLEGITQVYTDKIFAHLADLKLEGSDYAGMVIDLFDMITEANVNAKAFKDSKRQELIPLRMALLTGNDDILTNIGYVKEKRELWVEFAWQSRNDKVRATALRALGKIGAYARHESQIEELRFCISNILKISEGFRRASIYDDARHAIDGLTDIILKEPILLDDNELASLLKEVTVRLADIQGELLRQTPIPTDSPHPGSGSGRTSYQSGNEETLYLPVANLRPRSEPLLLAAEPGQRLRETDATLEKLGKLNLSEPIDRSATTPSRQDDAKTNELLKKLYSPKTEERQQARTSLVSQGSASFKPLLNMLKAGNLEPRLKISLSYALNQLPQPVIITDEQDIQTLTNLIGDDQGEVRQYVSEFLMKLSDSNTVRMLRSGLLTIPHDDATKTGEAVYNSVVILSTWARILPPELGELKQTLRTDLLHLQSQLVGEQWKKPRQLIDEINALK